METAVKLADLIAPAFYPLHWDVLEGRHTHYWLGGGRGSCKSTFISLEIVLGIMQHPEANAVVYRKVGATLSDSVFAQLLWAVSALGAGALWRAYRSPMRLVYRPTGQKIIFRGLDEATKSKSIKAAKGYFRYVWFEELSEFAGMEEIRSVCQSVLRGGRVFCCFYSYNPPKSLRNWVNSEALTEQTGRIVHTSDYRTVPPEWLGEEFLSGAEHLLKRAPEAYRHEYLGEATGTGTEVFRNLKLRAVEESEISQFDKINRGLDFGYAADPLHYTVNYYDAARRRLVIFYELHLLRTSNAALGGRIKAEMQAHGGEHSGYVCCDSAEPKSIDDLYLLGIPAYGATKGPGSLEWGMRFLAEELEEIVIDPARCPNTAREFVGYELGVDGNGNAIPKYPDRDNHSIDATRYSLERAIRLRYAQRR